MVTSSEYDNRDIVCEVGEAGRGEIKLTDVTDLIMLAGQDKGYSPLRISLGTIHILKL